MKHEVLEENPTEWLGLISSYMFTLIQAYNSINVYKIKAVNGRLELLLLIDSSDLFFKNWHNRKVSFRNAGQISIYV